VREHEEDGSAAGTNSQASVPHLDFVGFPKRPQLVFRVRRRSHLPQRSLPVFPMGSHVMVDVAQFTAGAILLLGGVLQLFSP